MTFSRYFFRSTKVSDPATIQNFPIFLWSRTCVGNSN